MKKRRNYFPRALIECIEPVTKPVFRKHGFDEMRLIRDWAQIVGPQMALTSAPHQVKYPAGSQVEGTLIIHVSSSSATVMQHMEPLLLEKLTLYFGYRAIAKVQLRQLHVKREAAKVAVFTAAEKDMAAGLRALAESLQREEV